jgi:hypothetical protein
MDKVEKLRVWLHGFRITAPQASQRATFKENSGPDPRAVADRKPLYVENATRYIGLLSAFGIAQRQISQIAHKSVTILRFMAAASPAGRN